MAIEHVARVVDYMYIPVHDGVIKYLKEKGLWDEKNDQIQKANVQLFQQYGNAFEKALTMADEKNIKVDPTSKEWRQLLEDVMQDLPDITYH